MKKIKKFFDTNVMVSAALSPDSVPGQAIDKAVKDDKFLVLAKAGQADCIVSGDKDLLVLHPFESITIIIPADFLNMF